MWMLLARCACDIRAHMRCVCVCGQSVAVKRSKVWAHITKLMAMAYLVKKSIITKITISHFSQDAFCVTPVRF